MKAILAISIAVGSLLSPAFAFAQSSTAPVTRAQVREDLIRLENAGYQPSAGDDPTYPANIQAAETKVAAGEAQSGVGAMPSSGRTEAGTPTHPHNVAPTSCVGPASFCDVYFGS
ncbi:DUF4148 domain-containing protein [Burkholderia anthina]|uniref:DUF4148 domain-containing protein n=1 Tax=Burkholderia anthina TaxID=179879 RepID=UPI001AA08E09|nr:DUF4148 domain-containing protein [Burkholderia anthina]QTD94782.1 DUF4148 domain-containing protein [Burkholderia anthina]